jgi:hypothetical protein
MGQDYWAGPTTATTAGLPFVTTGPSGTNYPVSSYGGDAGAAVSAAVASATAKNTGVTLIGNFTFLTGVTIPSGSSGLQFNFQNATIADGGVAAAAKGLFYVNGATNVTFNGNAIFVGAGAAGAVSAFYLFQTTDFLLNVNGTISGWGGAAAQPEFLYATDNGNHGGIRVMGQLLTADSCRLVQIIGTKQVDLSGFGTLPGGFTSTIKTSLIYIHSTATTGCSDINLHDMAFDGGFQVDPSGTGGVLNLVGQSGARMTRVTVSNVHISRMCNTAGFTFGYTYHKDGIDTAYIDRLAVNNCVFEQCGDGIVIQSDTQVAITNSHAYQCNFAGFEIGDVAATTFNQWGVEVSNCTAKECGANSAGGALGGFSIFTSSTGGNQTHIRFVNCDSADDGGTPYDALQNYVIGQVVSYSGSYYVCILASLNNLPTNGTYWTALTGTNQPIQPYGLTLTNSAGSTAAISDVMWIGGRLQGATRQTNQTVGTGTITGININTIATGVITLGATAYSGAMYDPGTNPTTGDSLATDCAAALQAALNAAVAAPYSATTPAKVVYQGGTYQFWNAGTTPVTTLIKSGVQVLEGTGAKDGVILRINSGTQTSITVTASVFTYTNATGISQYVRVIPGTETSGSATTTGEVITPYVGTTGSQVTGLYLLANGDNVAVTYGGGSPTMDRSVPFMAFSVQPASFKFSGFQVNQTTVSWSSILDMAYNPTGAAGTGAYVEAGAHLFVLDNVRITGNGPSLMWPLILDGMESGKMDMCQAPDFRWCVPGGALTIIGSTFVTGTLLAQTTAVYGTTFNAPITIANANIQGQNLSSFASITFPCEMTFDNIYFNGVAGTPLVVNNQSTSNTIINIKGGFWRIPSGAAGAFIKGHEGTTVANLYGGTTFTYHGNMPLFSVAPLGVFIVGQVSLADTVTAAQFLAHTAYANNAARALAGFSNALVSQQVATAIALQTTSTAIATYPATLTTGLYRVTLNVNSIAAAQTGAITITYFDATSSATTTITLSTGVLGNGAGWSWCGLVNALTGYTIAVAGSVTTNNDGLATCIIEAV